MKKELALLMCLCCGLASFTASDAWAKSKKKSKTAEKTKSEAGAKPAASAKSASAASAAPTPQAAPSAAPASQAAPAAKQSTPTPAAAPPLNSSSSSVFDGAMPDNSGTGIDFIKQPGRVGLGLTFGIPGFPATVKYFIQKNFSVSAYAPFYLDYVRFGLGLDVEALYEGGRIWGNSDLDLSWQAGGGAGMYWIFKSLYYSAADVATYGMRTSAIDLAFHGNIGLQLMFKAVPVEVVWDYRPGLEIMGYSGIACDTKNNICTSKRIWDVDADPFGFSVSGRYYF